MTRAPPGRPEGAKASNHAARRAELLARLTARLSAQDAMHASYRELAEAAGASISTLQHYFGKRNDILEAVFVEARRQAEPYLAHTRAPEGAFADSIAAALAFIRTGFEQFGLASLFAIGFAEGLRQSRLGPIFLRDVLEPSIDALAARLAAHQARGDMRADESPRQAAIVLLSPILLALLHQRELGGATKFPLDMDEFLVAHVRNFVAAYSTGAPDA